MLPNTETEGGSAASSPQVFALALDLICPYRWLRGGQTSWGTGLFQTGGERADKTCDYATNQWIRKTLNYDYYKRNLQQNMTNVPVQVSGHSGQFHLLLGFPL